MLIRNVWNCLPHFYLFFPSWCHLLNTIPSQNPYFLQYPYQGQPWQTLPDYNWLSFAITPTTLLKRQLLIRITILKTVPIKDLPVVIEAKLSFLLLDQAKHTRRDFFWKCNQAQYYKMTALKKSNWMMSKLTGSNVIKWWHLVRYSYKECVHRRWYSRGAVKWRGQTRQALTTGTNSCCLLVL